MILTFCKMFTKYVSKIYFIEIVEILGNKWNIVFMLKKIIKKIGVFTFKKLSKKMKYINFRNKKERIIKYLWYYSHSLLN